MPHRAPTSPLLVLVCIALGCGDDSTVGDDVGSGVDASTDASAVDAAFADAMRDAPAYDSAPFDGGPSGFLPAFPGAEGYGTDTPGGRGGRVYVVDTLEWDGPGSFSEALYATEPRTIVFAVSGVIDVPTDERNLTEEHSYLTIAGQTSPGGITLRGGGAAIKSYRGGLHDVVLRHLRFRGNGAYDVISLNTTHHIVIDHCDFSGAEDEALDITFSHDFTVQWSTISNSGPGGQRYGTLLAYAPTDNVSFHHNFNANHAGRCAPAMHWGDDGPPAGGARVDMINNVFYNCGTGRLLAINEIPQGMVQLNLIGNYTKAGPSTPLTETTFFTNLGSYVHLYAEDNVYEPDLNFFATNYHSPTIVEARHPGGDIAITDRNTARDEVLARAGAWPRDPMGVRTVANFNDSTGGLGEIGDALIEDGPPPPSDMDQDGMPDAWEEAHALNPSDAADGAADANGDGYTNLEDYLAERAFDLEGI